MDPPSLSAVFVYGSLKRGFARCGGWPRTPRSIRPAVVRGALFDLGHYPALLPGDDWISGELWELAPVDLPDTLRSLDRIEGYGQAGEADLYRRERIEVFADPGAQSLGGAWTYRLARPSLLPRARQIPAARRWGAIVAEYETTRPTAADVSFEEGLLERHGLEVRVAHWPDALAAVEEAAGDEEDAGPGAADSSPGAPAAERPSPAGDR